jgi:hypothetical protein
MVTYTAGYEDAAAVPADVKHAIKLMLSAQFEQRSGQGGSNTQATESGYRSFVNRSARSNYP